VASTLTGANRHDVTQLLPLVDAAPPVAGKPGRPRRRFRAIQGDRAYHSDPHRRELRRRGSRPLLARRGAPHGSGLGKYRWPVERTLSWMHQNRRLRTRYEKRDDTHEAFMELAEAIICWSRLHRDFC
jgi:transposase